MKRRKKEEKGTPISHRMKLGILSFHREQSDREAESTIFLKDKRTAGHLFILVFKCAVASLKEGVSVCPSVRPSVCPALFSDVY